MSSVPQEVTSGKTSRNGQKLSASRKTRKPRNRSQTKKERQSIGLPPSPANGETASKKDAPILSAADLQAAPPRELWPGRFIRGTLSLLWGHQGCFKTTL